MIIDGKKIALDFYETLKMDVVKLSKIPKLGVILVGENGASLRYIAQKEKWAFYTQIDFECKRLPEKTSEKDLLSEIEKWNNDESISGFLVQLPLPKHIDAAKVISAISPEKDVDGFHPINQGKLMVGDTSGFLPCTPAGIMEIFSHINYNVEGKNICVIGRSNIVGKPIAMLLVNAGATVTVCNSKTPDITVYTKQSDVIILATGVPNLLDSSMVGEVDIIIDVGFSVIDGKVLGDADTDDILKNTNVHITPVPGGVGALTVAMLLKNTYKAACLREKK